MNKEDNKDWYLMFLIFTVAFLFIMLIMTILK